MVRVRTLVLIVAIAVLAGTASAATSDTSVWFRKPDLFSAVDACFRGDFPRWGGEFDRRYDLPVTLVVTMRSIRVKNEMKGKSSRTLKGSMTAFHFNLREVNSDPVGPNFYKLDVMPDRMDPCVEVVLVNSAPAGYEGYKTITGELRL